MASPTETEGDNSFAREISITIYDDEDARSTYSSATAVYLPGAGLPGQKLSGSVCSSLSDPTGYYSLNNKLDDDGLDFLFFEQENSRPSSPDILHIPGKLLPPYGPSRYILEADRGFAIYSKRGWFNCTHKSVNKVMDRFHQACKLEYKSILQ
ncbi:hypothetical protein VP01_531g13 [Puccinia sorghi]|uniref:Uncharacterized protein n=1 Tax=Puccinia sorghi TaxID=27349 RepID=A0A0L6UKZ9_9BASI|nr:hypothetical protein VP01_531g13 [Puccinia sorghi]